tara:strand:- start:126 stop:569 length:444 start_codon:yes stop_codon:yes gene_type:complete
MGIFDFFKKKEQKPNYGKIIVHFLRIVLMDVHFKKLIEILKDPDKTLSGKISEITFFDEIIDKVFSTNQKDDNFISDYKLEHNNIKTVEQKTHLKNIMKECLINLIKNNFKFCNFEGDLEYLLTYIKTVKDADIFDHKLWESHYLKT